MSPTHDDWDQHLVAAEFAVDNAYHPSIGTTPFMLNYGQDPRNPAGLRMTKIDSPEAIKVSSTLEERLVRAKGFLEAVQQRQKALADEGRREVHSRRPIRHAFDPECPHEGTLDTEADAEVDKPIQDSSEGG